MFKIRNNLPGSLSVSLEKGSVTIQQGKSFDIEGDGRCTRTWIENDQVLRNWISRQVVSVVHDSESGPPKNITTVVATKRTVVPPKPEKPVIIDFGEVEQEEPVVPEEISAAPVEDPEPEPEPDMESELVDLEDTVEDTEPESHVEETLDFEEKEDTAPEVEPLEEPPNLKKMRKVELIEWAIGHGIDFDDNITKKELTKQIKSSDVYGLLSKNWGDQWT